MRRLAEETRYSRADWLRKPEIYYLLCADWLRKPDIPFFPWSKCLALDSVCQLGLSVLP